jgi:protein-disulfide isomerase
MSRFSWIAVVVLGFVAVTYSTGLFSAGSEKTEGQFTEEQKREIEKISSDYLISNPEVLTKAVARLQAAEQEKEKTQTISVLTAETDILMASKSPVIGNPDGDVVLVEFLDYQCPHCKKMEPIIDDLIKKNPNLKIVLEELPIFGEDSNYAAKAAFAAEKQGKFFALHDALLNEQRKLSQSIVLEIAKDKGLNIDQLKKDIALPALDAELVQIRALAGKLLIKGTPFFIVYKKPAEGKTIDKDHIFVMYGESPQSVIQEHIDSLK